MHSDDQLEIIGWPRITISRLWTIVVAIATIGALISTYVFDPRTTSWWIVDDPLSRLFAVVAIAIVIWLLPLAYSLFRIVVLRVHRFDALVALLKQERLQNHAHTQVRNELISAILGSLETVELDIIEIIDRDTMIVQSPSGIVRGPVRMSAGDTILILDMMEMALVGQFNVTRNVRMPNIYAARLKNVFHEDLLASLLSVSDVPRHRTLAIGFRRRS